MAILVKAFAILLALGLFYVTIKRAVLGQKKPEEKVPRRKPAETIDADDLVRCPGCGTFNPVGQPCATPDCPTHKG
ncbi:hypothetical protein L2U69_14625 [Zavarzinia compransoris]|uniref:hypothetical protein n=1 Tax=Zavarzinia marina TaxID=2911065 RepID=UPI001F1C269D|nr:hypothetical protein [Zavarzinia marina]MCF4166884.1 hypothetical protein [Zavarzinia marina]